MFVLAFEGQGLFFWVYFNSTDLPSPILVIEEELAHLLRLFTLFLGLLVFSVKTHSQDLHHFIVVVDFLLSGEVLESSMEAWTDL